MGLFDRLKKRNVGSLTGSIVDLAATINVMTVDEVKAAVAAGELNLADVLAAEAGPQGKNRKGVLALG